ncbi:unnamed protein product [Parajaminaea phylloscopi]
MLKSGGSSNAWSQSDLEDLDILGPAESSSHAGRHSANNGKFAADSEQQQPLSISLDFLKSGADDEEQFNALRIGSQQGLTAASRRADSQAADVSRSAWPVLSSSQSSQRSTAQQSVPNGGRAAQLVSGTSPSIAAPGSPFSSSSHFSEPGSPWAETSQSQWYRRTSQLVDDSDPVVLSSSQRSSRERSSSIQSNHWPSPALVDGNGLGERQERSSSDANYAASPSLYKRVAAQRGTSADRAIARQPVPASHANGAPIGAAVSGSPASFSSESSYQNWPPEIRRYQMASTALYRSSSASRLQKSNDGAAIGPGSPLATPGFVPWALNADANPLGLPRDQARDVNGLESRGNSGRRGPSPSRLDAHEYSSSPRVLETMPEGVEHHVSSSAANIGGFDRRHQRQRSTSSAAALGVSHPEQHRSSNPTWNPRPHAAGASTDAAKPMSALAGWDSAFAAPVPQHRKTSNGSGRDDTWEDGGETARQSPVDRRPDFPDLYALNGAGSQQQDPASKDAVGGIPRELSNSEGSLHASRAADDGMRQRIPSRRAVGFGLGNSTYLQDGPIDLRSLDADTPRSRSQGPSASRVNRGGFSEEDLAADLGQLNAELDKISAKQQQYDARQQGSVRSIDYRVPSSQAAATGIHAASMPPLFGNGDAAFSPGHWSSVIADREGGWRGVGVDDRDGNDGSHFAPAFRPSKSRSASLGPRPYTPPGERAQAHVRMDSGSASSAAASSAHQSTDAAGQPMMPPHAPSFVAGGRSMDNSAYEVSQGRAHGPGVLSARRQSAGPLAMFGSEHSGLLPASLKTPSAAGAVQSGVNVSASGFAPAPSRYVAGRNAVPPTFGDAMRQQALPLPAPAAAGQAGFDPHPHRTLGYHQGPAVLNDYALQSLAALAASGANPAGPMTNSGPLPTAGPSSFQELGRGVPLAHLPPDTQLYVVGFKQGRTDLFYRPPDRSGREEPIRRDDLVIVEADRGKDIGRVVNDGLTAEKVRGFLNLHVAELGTHGRATDGPAPSSSPPGSATGAAGGAASTSSSSSASASASSSLGSRAASAARSINPKRLYAKASAADTSLLLSKAADEERALAMCVAKVQQRGLPMHVLAAELQWDRRKLTFYYTAAARVDFRALVADLFKIWKLRVWMCDITSTRQQQMDNPVLSHVARSDNNSSGLGAGSPNAPVQHNGSQGDEGAGAGAGAAGPEIGVGRAYAALES